VTTIPAAAAPRQGHAYDLFILVLTLMSLAIMVLLFLPLTPATIQLLSVYDNVICVVFLVDFTYRIVRAPSKRRYFIDERGWLDLLGSIPSFGLLGFQHTGILRLARLSRLARILRLMQGAKRKELVDDVVKNRGQYATFVTVLTALMVMTATSVLVLEFESLSPDANITTGGDALWWTMVTITTVGYGDFFPVTAAGRITGLFVMLAGVGIIGSLASILASVLVPSQEETAEEQADEAAAASALRVELAEIKQELTALRQSLVPSEGGAADA